MNSDTGPIRLAFRCLAGSCLTSISGIDRRYRTILKNWASTSQHMVCRQALIWYVSPMFFHLGASRVIHSRALPNSL